jgi:mono/diheme cytochrome c family protein
MTRFLAGCAIFLLPVLVLGGLWAGRRDLRAPNGVFPTQMAVSPAARAQSLNPVLPNHMTLQLPVEGTLARGARLFHYGKTDAERQRAGAELVNSIHASQETLAEGRRLYETFCLVCHGASGGGDGPLIPKFPNPPNFRSPRLRALHDGEIFHTITRGRKKMAGFEDQLSWDERWLVLLYIRSLQEGKR